MHHPLSSQGRIRAAELFEQYSTKLMGVLRKENSNVDQADISAAIVNAIMSVASKGVQEDATKGKLLTLLKKIAQRCIIDQIRKEQRRRQREQKKSDCDVTNQHCVTNDPSQHVINRELFAQYAPELATDYDEQKYLQFWLEGYSDEEIADKFCSLNENPAQVTTLVNQISQRMRQRLSRLRKRLAEEDKP